MTLVLIWQLIILGKVLYVKVFQVDAYKKMANNQKEGLIQVPASRGKILDRYLEQLAVSVPLKSVFIYTPNIKDKEKTARALAEILELDANEILRKIDGNLKFRYIKKYVSNHRVQKLKALDFPGVGFLQESKRIYPKGKLASHILGALTHKNGKEVGLEGLEKYYDQDLCGRSGEIYLQRDGLDKVLKTNMLTPPLSGHTLILNIDHKIQHLAQRELESAIGRNHATSGIVIVMEPHSGQILALAVWPDFDPNLLNETSLSNMRNRAVEHYFEPGSTFKIIACSGVLDENLASPDEILYCGNGFITLSGHIIRDHKSFEDLSLEEILARSSDVGVIKLGMRLGKGLLHQYIRSFGFGEKTGIDLPAEISGKLQNPSRWSGISIGSISMGQEIGVTALQVVRSMCVVANGGYLVRPYVVNRILDDNGNLVRLFKPDQVRIISARTAGAITIALEKAVEIGTAKRADVPGYRIAGKTGTAQIFDSRQKAYSKTDHIASFIGFAPSNNPAFVIGVIFDSPKPHYHGGEVSAPVFSNIAREILLMKKIQPTERMLPTQLVRRRTNPPVRKNKPQPKKPEYTDTLLTMEDGPRETVISLIPENSFLMPNFSGMSLRKVLKECHRFGLTLNASGSGMAIEQIPPAGARIKPDTRCTVWFSNETEKISQLLGIEIIETDSLKMAEDRTQKGDIRFTHRK